MIWPGTSRHAVRHARQHRQVVRDQQHAHACSRAFLQQVQVLPVSSRRAPWSFVGDQEVGSAASAMAIITRVWPPLSGTVSRRGGVRAREADPLTSRWPGARGRAAQIGVVWMASTIWSPMRITGFGWSPVLEDHAVRPADGAHPIPAGRTSRCRGCRAPPCGCRHRPLAGLGSSRISARRHALAAARFANQREGFNAWMDSCRRDGVHMPASESIDAQVRI